MTYCFILVSIYQQFLFNVCEKATIINHPELFQSHWYNRMKLLPPPNCEGCAFISVGLFVCLSVNTITEKRVVGFSWNFQERSSMIKGTIWKVWSLFLCFQGNLCLLAALRENGWTVCHGIFSKVCIWEKEQIRIFSGSFLFISWTRVC